MKRILASILALTTIFSLAACTTSGSSATVSPGSSAAATQTPTAETPITLRLSSNVSAKEIEGNATAMAAGLNAWIDTLEAESNGSITIELFSDSQLASKTEEIVSGIQTGAFEVAHFATGNWAEYTDAFAELNVPYLYSSYDDVHKVMDSTIGENMMAQLEQDVPGIKALAYIDIGFRHITNSRGVIATPADMSGLKIRTMNDKLQMAAMEGMGASVTTLSISELYSGLQQKLVDAQENPLSTIYSNKFYEVNNYCTLTSHTYTSTFMFMTSDVYNKLSDNQKAAVDMANAACTEASRAIAPSAEADYQAKLEAEGMQFYVPTEAEMQLFKDSAAPAWIQAAELMGQARLDAVKALLS